MKAGRWEIQRVEIEGNCHKIFTLTGHIK